MNRELQNMSEESLQNLEEIVETELLTVEDIRERMDTTEKGKIRQSIQNCKYALEHDPCLKGAICRNEMTCQIDIMKKMPWKRRGVHMTDTDMNNLALYLEKNYGLTSDRVITKAIDIVANENSFHPILEYLESLKWDGIPRIQHMLTHFFGAEDIGYTGEVMKMHMMGAIRRLYEPGAKYDIMLCLVGGQGTGKSTFFRYLAIKDEWFTDDMKRIDDKKVYEYLQGHWIVEMSEMNAVANAKSIEETKSFLSRQKDIYRIPYERRAEDRYRQCVFCGTSNDLNFLPFDRTGNRRFAPVLVHPERVEKHILEDEKESREYIRQAWAEAMELYRNGSCELKLSRETEEYLKEMQKDFMPEDAKVGVIQLWLDELAEDYVCSIMIYKEAFSHEYDTPKDWELKEINNVMNHSIVGWEKISSHRFAGYGTQRGWRRVAGKNEFQKLSEDAVIPFEEK